MRPAARIAFSPLKYGQPLAVDSYTVPSWTGLVADGCAHDFDFYECLLVSRGRADLTVNGRPTRVRGPAIVITPPRAPRLIHVDDPLHLQLVVFSHGALTRCRAASQSLPSGVVVVDDGRELASLGAIAELMSAEVAALKSDSATMLEALVEPFVIALARARATAASCAPRLVIRFEDLLERRFHHDHRVCAYASALGVSADHLSAMLRAHRGTSAKSAIDRRLFDEAARLLISTRLTIGAIADRLGYDEPSHFTRAFRRACGVSPRRYRDSH
jgi:AraC family transcriptional activator of pobA